MTTENSLESKWELEQYRPGGFYSILDGKGLPFQRQVAVTATLEDATRIVACNNAVSAAGLLDAVLANPGVLKEMVEACEAGVKVVRWMDEDEEQAKLQYGSVTDWILCTAEKMEAVLAKIQKKEASGVG